jgi:peptidoglycan/xylan/chitin deacetylase (PgdA/CDA1 family)
MQARPALLALLLALLLGCAARAPAPATSPATPADSLTKLEVAVTVDDLPVHGPAFAGMDRRALEERFLAAFAAHHLPPVYGFVNGKSVDDDPATEAILRRWLSSGNLLGNHTWSHPSLNKTALPDYLADVRAGERILTKLAPAGDWKLFRYPFLQEGDTAEKHDGVRSFLSHEGYAIAEVTIDADDWAYSPPYVRCKEKHDDDALLKLHQSFVAGHVEELRRVRAFTRAFEQHDVPQILLLHLGAADANAIEDLLTAYEAEGVRWLGLRAALADPFYAEETQPNPFGSALPYRIARERGVDMEPPVWARGLEQRLSETCR